MKLTTSAEQIRKMGHVALETVISYYESLENGRAVLKRSTSGELRARFDEALPAEGSPFEEALGKVAGTAVEFSRHSAHPRFFGYVSSPGTAVTSLGSIVASELNINVTAWRSAPVGTEIERLTIRWLAEMIGFPRDAGGLLVSGGSTANFAGLAAARSAKAPGDVVRDGMAGARMRLYVSEEGHFSIRKAAAMLGIGTANLRSLRPKR